MPKKLCTDNPTFESKNGVDWRTATGPVANFARRREKALMTVSEMADTGQQVDFDEVDLVKFRRRYGVYEVDWIHDMPEVMPFDGDGDVVNEHVERVMRMPNDPSAGGVASDNVDA